MAKGAFSTRQLLRYPLVFGGCLAAYFTAFSFRKTYFKDEVEEVQRKNYESSIAQAEKMEAVKRELRAQKASKLNS